MSLTVAPDPVIISELYNGCTDCTVLLESRTVSNNGLIDGVHLGVQLGTNTGIDRDKTHTSIVALEHGRNACSEVTVPIYNQGE